MNEDLLKMQSEMIEDLRKIVKEHQSQISLLEELKLDLEMQVRILRKNNENKNY